MDSDAASALERQRALEAEAEATLNETKAGAEAAAKAAAEQMAEVILSAATSMETLRGRIRLGLHTFFYSKCMRATSAVHTREGYHVFSRRALSLARARIHARALPPVRAHAGKCTRNK
eukprot:4377880-Pleurochrysis_carterae.AAC.1